MYDHLLQWAVTEQQKPPNLTFAAPTIYGLFNARHFIKTSRGSEFRIH